MHMRKFCFQSGGGIVLLIVLLSACVSQVFAEGGYVSVAVWDNILSSSRGIAKAPDGTIWLSEGAPHSRIWRIAVDADYNPTFLEWFGGCIEHGDEIGHWHSGDQLNHTPKAAIDQYGSGKPGMFDGPYGIGFDNLGKAYVVDQQNIRVQILHSDRTIGDSFIGFLRDQLNEVYLFGDPRFVAVDSVNNVFINENFLFAPKISKFDSLGTFNLYWDVMNFAQGVAVSRGDTDSVFVSTMADAPIFNYTTTGVEIANWGQAGDLQGQLRIPSDLEVGSDGNIYVCDLSDYTDGRIQVFSPSGEYRFRYIRTFGTDPDETAQITDFFVDTNGSVYVSYDSVLGTLQKHSVQIFAPIFTITSPNGGEPLAAESTETIQWITRVTETEIPTVQLEYSLDNGATWQTIATDAPNTGSYTWLVPLVASNQCLIRITANDGDAIASDVSDGTFAIVNAIPASVDLFPRILYKYSTFPWMLAVIDLPTGYGVETIVEDSVAITKIENMCCTSCPPIVTDLRCDLTFTPWIIDLDWDGIDEMVVKFDRQDLLDYLVPGFYRITISGDLETSERFKGSEIICVLGRCM